MLTQYLNEGIQQIYWVSWVGSLPFIDWLLIALTDLTSSCNEIVITIWVQSVWGENRSHSLWSLEMSSIPRLSWWTLNVFYFCQPQWPTRSMEYPLIILLHHHQHYRKGQETVNVKVYMWIYGSLQKPIHCGLRSLAFPDLLTESLQFRRRLPFGQKDSLSGQLLLMLAN